MGVGGWVLKMDKSIIKIIISSSLAVLRVNNRTAMAKIIQHLVEW